MRTASRPRWNWGPSIRWFAAEFLVVMTGVLVALALNAWWQGRQDVAREQAYLQQLLVDLDANEELARVTFEYMDERRVVGSRLLDALRTRPLPPPDSLERWLRDFIGIAPLYPRMGTVQALIETGDLNLIRDDALRTSIIEYIGTVETVTRMVEATTQFGLRALGEIHQRLDVEALGDTASVHSAAEWSRLAEDPVFRGSVSALLVAHSTRRRAAEEILKSTTALRAQVEAARQ